ncbi:type VII secretion target [Saccharopolyspora sp. CA-218241]|uniref:type VII secretion target n=1 Tax=Saccharopolyspora sp. CA-218241 TaxID=3240027 RepID=UPI003D9517B4
MTFEVVTGDLTAHASHLDGLTARLETAVAAAETVSMSDDAYGLLCSFLPAIINPVEQEGVDAVKSAREGVSATADNVRKSAEQYREIDDANAASLSPIKEAVAGNRSAVAPAGEPVSATPVMAPNAGRTGSMTMSGELPR